MEPSSSTDLNYSTNFSCIIHKIVNANIFRTKLTYIIRTKLTYIGRWLTIREDLRYARPPSVPFRPQNQLFWCIDYPGQFGAIGQRYYV